MAKLSALEVLLRFEEEDPGVDQDGARWRLLASLKADLAAMAEADAEDLAEAADGMPARDGPGGGYGNVIPRRWPRLRPGLFLWAMQGTLRFAVYLRCYLQAWLRPLVFG